MRHKERKVPQDANLVGTLWCKPDGGSWRVHSEYYNTYIIGVNQFPNAFVEHCYDESHKGPPYLEGGPLNKWMFRTDSGKVKGLGTYLGRSSGWSWRYVGGFVANLLPTNAWFGDFYGTYKNAGKGTFSSVDGSHTWGSVSSYGPSAWRKFAPGKPAADAAVFLGEIRDLPRMLKTSARAWRDAYESRFGLRPRKAAKAAANHWLGLQFGWKPFVSDLRKFYSTYKKLDKTLAFLKRNNGKWIRRHGTVVEESEPPEVLATYTTDRVYPVLGTAMFPQYPTRGQSKFSRITSRKVWYSASYRYWVPNIESGQWRKDAARKLFGLELTPVIAWELLPWSWLGDWFTNAGDVIANYCGPSAVDNLVAKYAYLMGTVSTNLRLSSTVATNPPVTVEWDFELERKTRSEANPFGFGVTYDSLDARQWSILGALGLTRLL